MSRRRRAYMLIEMLGVLLLFATGMSLIMAGILAIHHSQQRLVAHGNRTAVLNDFIQCLSKDVRAATTARLRDGDGLEQPQVLQLSDGTKRVTYRFFEGRVEREGVEGDVVAPKLWGPMTATTSVVANTSRTGDVVVNVTVHWQRTAKGGPEPDRRFDFAVRCTGELSHDTD